MLDEVQQRKQALRSEMRKLRRDYAASLDDGTRALLFRRPPGPVMELVPPGAIVGVYYDIPGEAPARGYARFLHELGYTVALPAFTGKTAPMHFREWSDPFGESDLENGPYGPQPIAGDSEVEPDVVFVPLVAFTETGERMGQGAAHYDGWLAGHPDAVTIGMAWDVQKVDHLPTEPHDIPLRAIVTPSQFYGPFA
ncbi:MAG: 5-formyltetrahydrofolate cyclo-ligase [Candidatus Andeanibacterium colombiense]|uniref:5-formyltetrahydrofolate cyclo-ligase n=1 Tax=Candidatus Andeanibacterium colombiense TaxID=3121345 RepID=A0AAJ5X746_9SPHN|nr:MAG: 5-formyltetrahydrofolate cyclo-ligase [Sphingomonadaceae bacterium]